MAVIGTLLGGRYRLHARIGRGGMSTVYRACDIVLERPVAIKLMHAEIASDSDHLERFRREARAVAQLSHPHIVTVIDAGEEISLDGHDGHVGAPYIVLEYVPGETLKDIIRREGALDVAQACPPPPPRWWTGPSPRTCANATPTPPACSPISRRCWRSRPPAPDRPRARSRACCRRFPGAPGGGCPGACATPRAGSPRSR